MPGKLVVLVVCVVVALIAVVAVTQTSVLAPPRTRRSAGPRPLVFLGSAYATDLGDMVRESSAWPTVRRSCGLFVQPMGLRALGRDRYVQLMRLYERTHYCIVFNLGGVAKGVDPLRDVKIVDSLDSRFVCSTFLLYVTPDLFVDAYSRMVELVRRGCRAAKSRGLTVQIFMTPLSRDDDPANARYTSFLLSDRWWLKLVSDTGVDGIALDFPHIHWLKLDQPPWNVSRWRDVADRMCRSLQASGKLLSWSLNGKVGSPTSKLSDIDDFVSQLRSRGTQPDMWFVDHFDPSSKDQRGTPETAETTTGVGARLVRALQAAAA